MPFYTVGTKERILTWFCIPSVILTRDCCRGTENSSHFLIHVDGHVFVFDDLLISFINLLVGPFLKWISNDRVTNVGYISSRKL